MLLVSRFYQVYAVDASDIAVQVLFQYDINILVIIMVVDSMLLGFKHLRVSRYHFLDFCYPKILFVISLTYVWLDS